MKYIDAERLQKDVKRLERAVHKSALGCADSETRKFHEGKDFAYQHVGTLISSLQQETPDKETILRICKLHKAWSIMAPWENVEDFVMTNWNSENIV